MLNVVFTVQLSHMFLLAAAETAWIDHKFMNIFYFNFFLEQI